MTEIRKRLTVQRLKHSSLDSLLRQKGFYPGDYGWGDLIRSWNRLTPTKPREIELVFFRPKEEEFVQFCKIEPPAYAERKLVPASLFEILTAIPERTAEAGRRALCAELGSDFVLMVHGHYTKRWLDRGFPYIQGKYGWKLEFGTSILTSRRWSWYAGFRKLGKYADQPPP